MKPQDLDDHTPIEPDDALLTRVHTRSRAFRRRRSTQRLTSVMAGVVVIALAGGIAWTRVDTSDNQRITLPAATSTTTTTSTATTPLTQNDILGKWRPIFLPDYIKKGPLIATPPVRPDPYLSFNGRGSWTGADGCNGISGSYKLDENGVRFDTDIRSTDVLCGADHPVFLSIEIAPRSELRSDQLVFLAADGTEIARFARSGVTARIELPSTTMSAGSKMTGHVVVENNTGHVIAASGCLSLFQVQLGNDAIHPDAVWLDCLQPLPIPVGETSYPVQFYASYLGCSTPAQGDLKACIPNVGPPPLPPGEYQAQFFQSSPVVTPALPIDVNVVP